MIKTISQRRRTKVKKAPQSTTQVRSTPITIRLLGDEPITLAPPAGMERAAMQLAYVARNRRRWRGLDPMTRDLVAEQFTPDQLKAIAHAQVAEIAMPFIKESEGWASRIYPWEWVLSRLTKPYRSTDQPLTVIRHLEVQGPPAPARSPFELVCVVESTPGPLGEEYDVSGERALMLDSLRVPASAALIVKDPTPEELGATVSAKSPSLIHLAGFDTRQGAELLRTRLRERGEDRQPDADDRTLLDGMVLRDGAGVRPIPIDAVHLASLLTGGAKKPALVCFNFYNSGARTAPLTLAAGADAAIGFQDTIDDNLAEAFYATLYRSLSTDPAGLLKAFRAAITSVRNGPTKLQGACIVLWSRRSLLGSVRRLARPRAGRLLKAKPVASVPAAEQISVDAMPESEVNYSLVHNGRSLFKKLQIARRHVEGRIDCIEVAVTLYVGEDSFPFVTSLALEEADMTTSVAETIVVPLTSSLIRTQCERMQSTLHLRVTCHGAVVKEETYGITLAPVDEWTDTDENRLWLPSFVLPRDPAVVRIIDSAQRYLMAIADDPAAGFDGYQSVDAAGRTLEEKYGAVDDQVRAIWCALLYDHRLSYVNPPPSYGTTTQRLRIPSNILEERRGTCIDLALLLCACLEAVDIYPVIFLLEGHAFPGYWRADTLHDAFRTLSNVDVSMVERLQARGGGTSDRDQGAHTVGREGFFEIRDLVTEGSLVPLETIWLTNYSGFAEALDEGVKNLRNPQEFQAMVDIVLARRLQRPITPLPMLSRMG